MKRFSILAVTVLMFTGQACTQNTNNKNSEVMNKKENKDKHKHKTMIGKHSDEWMRQQHMRKETIIEKKNKAKIN